MTQTGSQETFSVLVLGGGCGGISVAARLRKHFPKHSVAILEPSSDHFYQPLWTLVGGGVVAKEKSRKSQASVIPSGVRWIPDGVRRVFPDENRVETSTGRTIRYEYLIVATGLSLDWAQIEGAENALAQDGVGSIYDYRGAEKTAGLLKSFQGGTALFTMPPVPIKCAGAPQKILYLAEEIFRRTGVRDKTRIVFASAGPTIFGIPEFAKPLMAVLRRKGVETLFAHKLVAIKGDEKKAVFESDDEIVEIPYDLLHVVPPMKAHDYVKESGLAVGEGPHAGWLAVDQHTLRHPRYGNVFGVGDVTGVPNSKTGAAIRKQAPVVAENILAIRRGKEPKARYDGYSSCPLVTGFGKVILAEFGYGGKLLPSFPFDATKERRSMWLLKRYFLPKLYWQGMLKGRA